MCCCRRFIGWMCGEFDVVEIYYCMGNFFWKYDEGVFDICEFILESVGCRSGVV